MISSSLKRLSWLLMIVGFGALAFAIRCWNLRDVFVDDRIFFIDPDCYSRMTRVASIAEGGRLSIRHHDFENWPEGITPHTTALLDWLIVGGKWIADGCLRAADGGKTSVLRGQTLDFAGALISPVLGALTCGWLAAWALAVTRHSLLVPRHAAFATPLLFLLSPVVVHGGALGRPDHQSLVLLLLAIAIGAEVRLMQTARESARRGILKWAILGGAAGGLAMWVSLYEPLILFGIIFALIALLDRSQFRWRERWLGWALAAAIYGASLLIDGWRISLPDATARTYFANWSRSIGELAHLDPREPLLWHWCGWGVALAPFALGVAIWGKRRVSPSASRPAAFLLSLLLITLALTCWQVRWGYFLALVFAMSLPWQLAVARRAWIAWPVFLLSLYPVAQDWDTRLFPDEETQQQHALQRAERVALRRCATVIAASEPGSAFLAPWWQSPALAYWTRHPGVAGSSHQSLAGIVETARFFLAADPQEAAAVLKRRPAAWVVVDDAERMTTTSASLLGIEPPGTPFGLILADSPHHAPAFLREQTPPAAGIAPGQTGGQIFFRLYAVDAAKFPP